MLGWKGEPGGHLGSSSSKGLSVGGKCLVACVRFWTALARHTSANPNATDILQSSYVTESTVLERLGRLSPASKTSRAHNQ